MVVVVAFTTGVEIDFDVVLVTAPMLLSILSEVELEVIQEKVVLFPPTTGFGVTLNDWMVGGTGVTGIACVVTVTLAGLPKLFDESNARSV